MENKSFEAMVAMRKNGHIDRDHNGKDITELNYLKHRRRECKEKGIDYEAAAELAWFRDNWIPRPQGRPPKGDETRKAVTFRLQPKTIDRIRTVATDLGCSMGDLIEDMMAEMYP